MPSLALEMFRVGVDQQEFAIHASDQVKAPKTGLLGVSVGQRFIPTDDNGQIAVNFRGPAKAFPYLPAVDILHGHHRAALKDKYVLIGGSASGLFDLVATPFANLYSGVEVHASITDNLVAGLTFMVMGDGA